MKVLDLSCSQAHVFEAWFASEDEFRGQLQGGLLDCPLCGDRQIEKRLSAPRLNLGATEAPRNPPVAGAATSAPTQAQRQAHWLRTMREAVAQAEDVGERFADEARRMHHGETPERQIRGRSSAEETLALLEEGVPVLPLPALPEAVTQTLQ